MSGLEAPRGDTVDAEMRGFNQSDMGEPSLTSPPRTVLLGM